MDKQRPVISVTTAAFSGPLQHKLAALNASGIHHIQLDAADLLSSQQGTEGAIRDVLASGVAVTCLRELKEVVGCAPQFMPYKMELVKSHLGYLSALKGGLLVVTPTTSRSAVSADLLVEQLAALARLAMIKGIRVALRPTAWSALVPDEKAALDIVAKANHANLGVVLDAISELSEPGLIEALLPEHIDRVFLVRLSDFESTCITSIEDLVEAEHHQRLFVGEGVHGDVLKRIYQQLVSLGYQGEITLSANATEYDQQTATQMSRRAAQAIQDLTQD